MIFRRQGVLQHRLDCTVLSFVSELFLMLHVVLKTFVHCLMCFCVTMTSSVPMSNLRCFFTRPRFHHALAILWETPVALVSLAPRRLEQLQPDKGQMTSL